MSVISLSSEDEDECIVLDSDDEDSRSHSPQTHKVFIVENIHGCSFNKESDSRGQIGENVANNMGEQNMSYNCNDKITNSNKNCYNEVSFPRNENKTTHHSINLSDSLGNPNGLSASPDEIQRREQLVEDLNHLSNQTVDILSETNKNCTEKEGNCSTSQRDEIFCALQLSSVSLGFQKSNAEGGFISNHAQPITSTNKGKKSENTLIVLAEKLAQVLGNNNHCDVSNMSNIEKTILEVSRGSFAQDNKSLGSNTTSQTIKNRSSIKHTKRKKKTVGTEIRKSHKFNSDVEVSKIQATSSTDQSMQIVSADSIQVDQISQATKCVKKNSKIELSQTNMTQPKRTLNAGKNNEVPKNPISLKRTINALYEPDSAVESRVLPQTKLRKSKCLSTNQQLEPKNQANVVKHLETSKNELKHQQKQKAMKSKKSISNSKSYKPPSPHNGGPYDNKLKFTFDRSVSVYSVSVVSPSEPQPPVENINNTYTNDFENAIEQNLPSCHSLAKEHLPEIQNTENNLQPETLSSGEFTSPIMPPSNMIHLKGSFVKHYNIVFDDKTDVLCVEMGYSLLQAIKESKKFKNLMETPQTNSRAVISQQSHNFLFGSDEFKTALQTCQDKLNQLKKKFIDKFSQVYDQINLRHIVGTQLKIVFLTAWFMKMFLGITTKSPDLMDVLHEIKLKTIDLLSEEILRWPLICKTFIKDERQFECDCLLVLEFIKDCLKDQSELNSQSNISCDQIKNSVELQSVACATSNDRGNKLPKELQRFEKKGDIEISLVITDSTETKNTNCISITNTDSIQYQTNKQDNLVITPTKVDLSKECQSTIKPSTEPLQISRFTSNLNNASCNTHLQKTSESNYFDKTDKSPTKSCEMSAQNQLCFKSNMPTPNMSCSQDKSKEVFQSEFNHKRKNSAYNNRRLKSFPKNDNLHCITDESQKPKQHETRENVQPRSSPSSLVPVQYKADKDNTDDITRQWKTSNIFKTNIENDGLILNIGYGSKKAQQTLVDGVQFGEPDLRDQHFNSPEIVGRKSVQNNIAQNNIQHQTQSNQYPQDMLVSSLQSQYNHKPTQDPYLKEHLSNTELPNQPLQINQHMTFPSDQKLDHQKKQLYEETQSKVPPPLQQNNESDFFLGIQSENQPHPNYTLKLNNHGQQNIPHCLPYQPNLYNYKNSASKYPQNQYPYSNQSYYQESSANRNKITTAAPNGFYKDNFYSTNSCASYSNKQQFPVRNGGAFGNSTCPISIRTPAYSGVTINNYNFSSYSPIISPDLLTNYNDSTISNNKGTVVEEASYLPPNLY